MRESNLADLRRWGLGMSNLDIRGYRDPLPGEALWSDGARSGITCAIVGAEQTETYELKSFWPGDPNKAPTNTDTCKHFTIWGNGLEDFSVQSEDTGSAIFGRAENGNGVDFVGLMVSAWSDKGQDTLPGLPAARYGLAVPALRVFSQLHRAAGKHWVPA